MSPPFLIQLGMFGTPAIYLRPEQIPADNPWVRLVLWLNPINSLITAFRAACLGGEIPWLSVGLASVLVVGIFLAGCLYFRKVEDWFADII